MIILNEEEYELVRKKENNIIYVKCIKGAVALSDQCAAPFQCKKITAKPRKNSAVGVKYKYAATY